MVTQYEEEQMMSFVW